MSRVKHIRSMLETLHKLKPTEKREFIKAASPRQISYFAEIILNFLQGNFIKEKHILKKLYKFRKHLHILASREYSIKQKKDILMSIKGAFILHLLVPKALVLLKNI